MGPGLLHIGAGVPFLFCFAMGVGKVLVLGGVPGTARLRARPASPGPRQCSAMQCGLQGYILLIRHTQTGNLYKHKRIHFQKNKLLRGEEERVHFVFLNKYAILLT